MNRRLQQFLELEQLKPAQFADIMGIQRANVSHILSGRNKPSFEFIQKFLLKFPSVSPDWFILGKGKPSPAAQQRRLVLRTERTYRHQQSAGDHG